MLMANDRGGHATGFTDSKVILKSTSDVEGFYSKDREDLPLPNQIKQFVAHTRFATTGGHTLANIHPFNYGNLIGVHNGVIENFDDLKKEYGDAALKFLKKKYSDKKYISNLKEIESDSALAYYLVSTMPFEEVLKLLKGTMAFVWFDQENKINVYRSNKPLCYGFKNETLWFGSLKKYLEALECRDIKSFTEHAHFIIDKGRVDKGEQLKKSIQPFTKKQIQDKDKDFIKEVCEIPKSSKVPLKEPSKPIEESFNFKAPYSAKTEFDTDTGDLILWWFSEIDPDILYVEISVFEDIICYDLSDKINFDVLKEDLPDIFDDVVEEHEKLIFAYEIRESYENA